jgi:hypothetical protein
MREEIRLGNEALAQDDLEAAEGHFQQLLDNGGTPIQEQIATNRLREIREKQAVPSTPPPPKRRTRRKATGDKTPDKTVT